MSDFVKIELDQKSVNEVNRSLRDYGKRAGRALMDAILKTGLAIETDAKSRLKGELGSAKHWITGRLATSVHMESKEMNSFRMESHASKLSDGTLRVAIADDEAVVGTNVKYASDIEFGHPERVIVPINAKALRFKPKGSSEYIFRKRAVIPAFEGDSFLRFAGERQEKKFAQRVTKELNNIK